MAQMPQAAVRQFTAKVAAHEAGTAAPAPATPAPVVVAPAAPVAPVTPAAPATPAASPVTPTPPQAPATPQQRTEVVDVAALQRQIDELKSRQSGADRARADAEALLREHLDNAAFMQERLRELAEENQRLKDGGAPGPKPSAPVDEELKLELATESFTEEEQRTFGEKTKQYVTKVIRAEVAQILAPVLAKINALATSSGDVRRQVEEVASATTAIAPIVLRSAEKEFYEEQIKKHFSDFDSRRVSPEWKAYLSQVDPLHRKIRADVLREASLRKDGPAARRVLQEFYDTHPSSAAPANSGIVVEAPSSAGTGSSIGAPGPASVPKFRYSEYTAAFKAWQRAPKNPGARQVYDQMKARYETALAAGNVDFNS